MRALALLPGCEASSTPEPPAGWRGASPARPTTGLAVVDPVTGERWLFEATPDLRDHLHELNGLFPVGGTPGRSGVSLTPMWG